VLRATLDKGPRTKSPRTNLKQIESWIGHFQIDFFYKKCTMSAFKGLGSNLRVQYKMCDWHVRRIKLTFDFFSFLFPFFFSFMVFSNFLFSLSFHTLGNVENALFLTITLQEFTKSIILILELIIKWRNWCALNNVLNP
jgi:hypothetical protein